MPGEGYRFEGLTKAAPNDRKASAAVKASQDDGVRPDQDSGSQKSPEQRAERHASSAEPDPPQAIPADGSTRPAPTLRFGFVPFAAVVAALVLFAGLSGWFFLGGRSMKPAQAGHLSIVVLPFANLSGDPAQDCFADGITDNLTTELSRIAALEAPSASRVIARSTAFTYNGRNIDAHEIGRELGVRYVLEGSVQRDQGRVRVNAQLIDAASGAQLWADRFAEDVADLFKLQDEVVARLAFSLGLASLQRSRRRRSDHARLRLAYSMPARTPRPRLRP